MSTDVVKYSNVTETYFTTSGPRSFVFLQVMMHCKQKEWLQFGKIPNKWFLGSAFSYTLSMQMPQVTFLLWRKLSISSTAPWLLEAAAAAAPPSSVVSLEEVSWTQTLQSVQASWVQLGLITSVSCGKITLKKISKPAHFFHHMLEQLLSSGPIPKKQWDKSQYLQIKKKKKKVSEVWRNAE